MSANNAPSTSRLALQPKLLTLCIRCCVRAQVDGCGRVLAVLRAAHSRQGKRPLSISSIADSLPGLTADFMADANQVISGFVAVNFRSPTLPRAARSPPAHPRGPFSSLSDSARAILRASTEFMPVLCCGCAQPTLERAAADQSRHGCLGTVFQSLLIFVFGLACLPNVGLIGCLSDVRSRARFAS